METKVERKRARSEMRSFRSEGLASDCCYEDLMPVVSGVYRWWRQATSYDNDSLIPEKTDRICWSLIR